MKAIQASSVKSKACARHFLPFSQGSSKGTNELERKGRGPLDALVWYSANKSALAR